MRSLRSEKGISPIVATILLIATTAVAAGVIAAYVSGLSVITGTIIAGDANGFVYDQDQGAGENYTNGKLYLTVKITQGRLRDIDDTTYGFTVSLSNGRSGWSMTFNQDNNMTAPVSGASGTISFSGNYMYDNARPKYFDYENWATESITQFVQENNWIARISGDSQHRWSTGSSMIIEVDNLFWDPGWTTLDNVAWRDGDTIQITIAGRDTLSLTGFSGAYLSGTRVG